MNKAPTICAEGNTFTPWKSNDSGFLVGFFPGYFWVFSGLNLGISWVVFLFNAVQQKMACATFWLSISRVLSKTSHFLRKRKPCSVLGNHLSWMYVTIQLARCMHWGRWLRLNPNVLPCTKWGLHCHNCRQSRGGLLPHPFNLTTLLTFGGLLSVALSFDLRRQAVSLHSAMWCTDFPHNRMDSCAIASITKTV